MITLLIILAHGRKNQLLIMSLNFHYLKSKIQNPKFKIDMRARIDNQILFIHHEDLPEFKKGGSVVRNSYFWALRSIAGKASRYRDWEYEPEVWLALSRMLLSFAESGYLGLRETLLEFPLSQGEIPSLLRDISTFE